MQALCTVNTINLSVQDCYARYVVQTFQILELRLNQR